MGPDSYSDILPSFSISNVDSQDDERFTLDSEMAQQFIQANPDLAQFASLLANNHTYLELLDRLISQVDQEIESNRRMQNKIRSQLVRPYENISQPRRANISVPCWPPYFKDSDGMAPNMNSEALEISRICSADPLVEEEKRWVPNELELLRDSVCSSMKDGEISLLDSRKEIFQKKLRAAGVETTNEQRQNWIDEVERINRRIAYIRSRSVNDFLKEHSNYESVDWPKISARDFKGVRTISQLRQKWCNEMCPAYNKEADWTVSEDEKLIDLSRDFSNWDVISEMLGSSRPPLHCFQRLNYLRQIDHEPNQWTPVEDQKLRKLIMMHRVGDEIPWARISVYMPGRSKQSCEYRYTRSLSEKIRHGRWTEAEDILLLEAINKYGPRNWVKISNSVRGRSALQCRDRWIHVLDHKRRDHPWTWEEHMRLFYGVRLFGRDECAKIARLLPGRNNMDVRLRIRFLVRLQIEAKMKDKPIIFRHFANNYLFFKTRRKTIFDEFSKYLETKQNDRKASMAARLGLGSFVATPNVGVYLDYTNVRKLRIKEFDDWSVMNSGRWVKFQYKNPNEQDRDDLLHELEQLSDETRKEALLWLKESDARLEAELEQEKEVPEDPKQAVEFYDKMFTNERIDELFSSVNELLPARECDILYYIKHQKRARKIGVLRKRKKPKKNKKPTVAEIVANIDKLDNNQLIGLRWADKLLVDLNKEIIKLPEEERRHYLITKLCGLIRHRLHYITLRKFKDDENLTCLAFKQMLEYVKERLRQVHTQAIYEPTEPMPIELPSPDPKQPPLVLPSNWRNLTMKDLLRLKISPQLLNNLAERARSQQVLVRKFVPIHGVGESSTSRHTKIVSITNRAVKIHMKNLLPPCIATINCMDLYNKTIRGQLQRDLSSYRVNSDPDAPGTSTETPQVFDLNKAYGWSNIKDQVRTTPEYALLKMRMFRLFFYPLAMIKSQNNL